MTPDTKQNDEKPGSAPARPPSEKLSFWVERARRAWRRLTAPVIAWHERTEGESEELYVADLVAPEPIRRWDAAAALRRNPLLGNEAVEALVRALGDDEEFVAWQASEALAAQEPGHVFAPVEAALTDADPARRVGAAQALGKLGGDAAVAALRNQITDPEPQVRAAVASALGQMHDPNLAETLLPLIDDADPEVVRAAARALGHIANTVAACPMAAALVRPGQDVLVRRALAAGLAHIPHPDAQEPLLEALHDPDPQVRAYAATALGHVGNEQAHAPLQDLTNDKSRLIKGTVSDQAKRAVELLERRGRRQAA
jgi:HEAT repeat protein